VKDVETDYKIQTDVMTVQKQITEFIDYFKRMFNYGNDTAKKSRDEIGHLEHQIRSTQLQIDQMNQTQPFILVLLATVSTVALLYMFGSGLGVITHFLAIGILIGGIVYATNYSQANK
jgi:hypothetical protein